MFDFDPDYFDFLPDEIKELRKTVCKNVEKDIKERSFVFGVVETILKDVVFELLLFRIYNHLFFCLKGNRMIGKCKLCGRIFIKDMDHARKIENYFKITRNSIKGSSISMLMNKINAKSVVDFG